MNSHMTEDTFDIVRDRKDMREILFVGNINIKRQRDGAKVPARSTRGSLLDVFAAEEVLITSGEVQKVGTGFSFELPVDWMMDIRPRGSLSFNKITIVNSPGTLDYDYRGEFFVFLHNQGKKGYWVKKGNKIAQINFLPIPRVTFTLVDELSETERGSGHLGSTGQ